MRAGKEEAAYTTITAKPRPTVFPRLQVQLENPSASNGTVVRPLGTSQRILANPSQPLTYIIIDTFTVPRDIGEMTSVRFRFDLPDASWSSNDRLDYADIGIISGERHNVMLISYRCVAGRHT